MYCRSHVVIHSSCCSSLTNNCLVVLSWTRAARMWFCPRRRRQRVAGGRHRPGGAEPCEAPQRRHIATPWTPASSWKWRRNPAAPASWALWRRRQTTTIRLWPRPQAEIHNLAAEKHPRSPNGRRTRTQRMLRLVCQLLLNRQKVTKNVARISS